MLTSKPTTFQKSCLAVAVVALSACSSTPRSGGFDLGDAGDTLGRVGDKTLEVTGNAWDKTMYLLGFSDVNPSNPEPELLDEVDLALMKEDAILPDMQSGSLTQPAASQGLELVQASGVTRSDALPLDPGKAMTDDALMDIEGERVAMADYEHTVRSDETLWDIAKKTTGDANNWHILADVNDLAPNASVHPGQQLLIPADMVKPELTTPPLPDTQNVATLGDDQTPTNAETLTVASNQTPINAEAAPAARLTIPAAGDASQTAAADTVAKAEPQAVTGTPFDLQPGETLWDFAKRTTGDATNWQAIAAGNQLTEQQVLLVQSGQTIHVPESLVREELKIASISETPTKAAATDNTIAAAAPEPATQEEAVSASASLITESSVLDETQPIRIVEAAFQADSSPKLVTEDQLAQEASETLAASTDAPGEIMVSGTYYPKAIYNNADFSSSLLMRVSPGTRLQVSRALGPWFEVKTDEGTGYVHSRDIK